MWLYAGLWRLWTIVLQGHYQLRIDLEYWNGTTKYALYKSFRIGGPDEKYKLQAYKYSGDAGKTISGPAGGILLITVLLDFPLTVKAAPHDCIIGTGQT